MWWPAVAMAALTFVVWLRMYFMRVGEMKRERVHPQSVGAVGADGRTPEGHARRRQFPQPV